MPRSRAICLELRPQRSVTRNHHAQARHTRRGEREGVQLRRVIFLLDQAADTADDESSGSKAELMRSADTCSAVTRSTALKIGAVGDHAKLVERHGVVLDRTVDRATARRPREPHRARGQPVAVDVAPGQRSRAAAAGNRRTDRAPGTQTRSASRLWRGCRCARAASPPYNIGRGL